MNASRTLATFFFLGLAACAGELDVPDDGTDDAPDDGLELDATETTEAAELGGLGVCASEDVYAIYAGGVETRTQLWPGRRIPFTVSGFYAGSPTPARVTTAVNAWNLALGGVLQLVPATSSDVARLNITPGTLNQSEIGYGGVRAHAMTLNSSAATATTAAVNPGVDTILHELGHAAGLHHEHQRQDRARYLNVDTSNAVWGLPGCYAATEAQVRTLRGQTVGVYEYGSIMHYGSSWTRPAMTCMGINIPAATVNLFTRRDTGATLPPFFGMTAPSARDAAGVAELYAMDWKWKPFQAHGVELGSTQPISVTLAPGVTIADSPAVASQKDGSQNLFVRGSDGHIWMRWSEPASASFPSSLPVHWSGWFDLGGPPGGGSFDTEPAAASWGPGQVAVAVRGPGGIWFRLYANAAWGSWIKVGAPSLATVSAPALISRGTNKLSLFVRSGSRVHAHAYNGGFTGGWLDLGGNIQGRPAAATYGTGYTIIAHAAGGGLVEYRVDGAGAGWTTWNGALAGTLRAGSSPAVTSWGVGTLNVFVRGGDNELYQKFFANGAWSGWYRLGGVLAGNPSAVSFPTSQQVHVFAPMLDGARYGIWQKTYSAAF